MKLNIGDKVMVKARGDEGRHWNLRVDTEYCEATIEGEVRHSDQWNCDTVLAMGPHHRQHVPISAIKPIKKPFRLKDGKKYETADGVVFKVQVYREGLFDHKFGDENLWREDGTSIDGSMSNLIRRHYTKPQPAHKLDLQKGDVVELVKWEDGAGAGVGEQFEIGNDGLKSDFYKFKQPKGERPLFRVVSRQAQSS